MSQRFDTILKSGTVVNQDGEGVRDVAIANGRIAEIGSLSRVSAAEACPSEPIAAMRPPAMAMSRTPSPSWLTTVPDRRIRS